MKSSKGILLPSQSNIPLSVILAAVEYRSTDILWAKEKPHWPMVALARAVPIGWLDSVADAEDVLQDAFLRLARCRPERHMRTGSISAPSLSRACSGPIQVGPAHPIKGDEFHLANSANCCCGHRRIGLALRSGPAAARHPAC